jgi:hypothetical protein
LTGKESEKALREFLREDTTLATEIANRCGATHLAAVLTGSPADVPTDISSEESIADFHSHDDSDVSLNAVLQDSLGITVNASDNSALVVAQVSPAEIGSLGLVADDDAEDIWAYTDDGVRWNEVGED